MVSGLVKDLDVPEPQQLDGINISWRCENLMNQSHPCKNIKGETLPVNQSSLTQRYEPRII